MTTNGHLPTTTQPVGPFPDLVIPELDFDKSAYASIQLRLDLYDDFILATRYAKGVAGAVYAVDPADLATALSGIPVTTGFLPLNCLFLNRLESEIRLAIYIEPRVWPVSVEQYKRTWHVPLPGLIFVGKGNRYSVAILNEM